MRLRTVLIAIAAVLILVVGGAVVLVMSIDIDRYAAAAVEQATGRKLTINGDFTLSFSLTPTLNAHDLSLSNLPGSSTPEMITAKRLKLRVQLLPLFSGIVKIERLVLDDADIFLETDKTGRGNWVFNLSGVTAAVPASSSAEPMPEIDLVEVHKCRVRFFDGETGRSYSFLIDKLGAATKGGRIELDLAATRGTAPITVKGSVGAPELLSGGTPYPFDLAVTSGPNTATVEGAVGDITVLEGLAADVTAKGARLSDLNGLLGMDLPAAGPYSLTAEVVGTDDGYRLSDLALALGSSRISGDLAISLGERPKITAELASERIDLNDVGAVSGAAGSDRGRVFPASPLPFDLLRTVDANIKLSAKSLVRGSRGFTDVKLRAVLAGGKLRLGPFTAGAGTSRLSGDLAADASRTPPVTSFNLTATNIEAGSFVQLVTGDGILSGGRAQFTVRGTGAGNSLAAIVSGLNGTFDYDMTGGNLDNGFAKVFLADLFSLVSFGSSGNSSNVRCVVARFAIGRGLATSRQLVMETKSAVIVGNGTIDLAAERVDIALVPYATSPSLATFAVPMRLQGNLSSPRIAPDPVAMAKGVPGTVLSAPVTALSQLGGLVGIGGGDAPSRCAEPPAAVSGTGILEGVGNGAKSAVEGVGNGAKSAVDALKGLLP